MKKGMLIGLIAGAVGCAGMSQRALASNAVAERWQGFMLRDGLRVPISLDVAKREVNLEVSEEELAKRKSQARRFGAQDAPGYLGIYQRLVQPVHKGATLT